MLTLAAPADRRTAPAALPYTPDCDRAAAGAGELALLRRMAAGDERALGELCDRWARPVHAAVLRLLDDPSQADDIVALTFWQAWRQAARYEPTRGAVSTWLIAIGRSRALDLLRARRRRREDEMLSTRALADLPAPAADPAACAEALERRHLVLRALDALPAGQREVLELAYFDGLSQTEIASRTGLPLGTVKTRCRLAMRKLRVRLRGLD